jgi:hypothetical protein
MAQPASRQELIDYCLRRLGSPVLEINVDEDQIEDRVDDALIKYREFHSDATVRIFLKHTLTADDVTNKYIPISADIPYVMKVFPFNPTYSNVNMFDIRYQMMLASLGDFMQFAGGMSYYYQLEQYLDYLDNLLTGQPITSFSRRQNRLYIHGNIEDGDIKEGQVVLMEALQFVDGDSFTSIWNDTFLKDYTTALIKRQWGENMIKFEGMQLPGGVTLNGRQYYDDAVTDLERLEEKMRLEYELPVDFFMG